jgi:hypothetical protein
MTDGSNLPTPDPTPQTSEAISRAMASERDYVDGQLEALRERMRGIDRATSLLNQTVTRTPTEIQKEVTHLRELMDERKEAVDGKLNSAEDQRKEQKKDTKDAVDAALAAAKEAVKEQTTASQLSINKSETSFAEQLKQQNVTFNTANSGLTRELQDVKDRVGKIENLKQGGQENKAAFYAAAGLAIAVVILLVALFNANNLK